MTAKKLPEVDEEVCVQCEARFTPHRLDGMGECYDCALFDASHRARDE